MINPVTFEKNGKKMIHVESKLLNKRVESHITVSKDLEKYFLCYDFFSNYDESIYANTSILNIPVLSLVLPLAWITGSDVYVEELDDTFAKSMNALQLEYKKIYPKAPFKTKLIVNNLVNNEFTSRETAIIFSGGLDSTYSLYSNRTLDPRLIMILGVYDIPSSNTRYHEKIKREYLNFAEKEGLKLNFIHTNAVDLMDYEISGME
jgi:hypothetical protein